MNEEKRTQIWQWLIKSQHDLGSARRLMGGEEPYLDTAVYHCQQAVEKALKGFLSYHDVIFGRTHDLTELVALSAQVESTLDAWRDVASELTPYAVRFRYPAEVLEPELDEAERALADAQASTDFIIDLLPEEVIPQSK